MVLQDLALTPKEVQDLELHQTGRVLMYPLANRISLPDTQILELVSQRLLVLIMESNNRFQDHIEILLVHTEMSSLTDL